MKKNFTPREFFGEKFNDGITYIMRRKQLILRQLLDGLSDYPVIFSHYDVAVYNFHLFVPSVNPPFLTIQSHSLLSKGHALSSKSSIL